MAEALQPDVLLLDIAMPGLDGIEVARALADRRPSPAVIFVTAFDQFAVAAFDVAAIDYLMKPVDAERGWQRALDRARAYLRQRGEMSATSAGAASPWLEEFWASDLSGLVRIAARDVDRVSAERDYMRLHVGRAQLADPSFDEGAGGRAGSASCSSGCTVPRSCAATSSPASRATPRGAGSPRLATTANSRSAGFMPTA